MSDSVSARWAHVQSQIAEAAEAAGRNVEDITTIVVTKFHSAATVRELYDAGVRHVGENRHQEAFAKHAQLSDLDLTWHFVGQLQSNKARAVAEYCSVIHSVDRSSLVEALARVEGALDVFIELNLTTEPHRGGVQPARLLELVEQVLATPNVRLRGLMAVAPQDEQPRVAFARVRQLADEVLTLAPEARDLSIGMSGDYEEAIAAGATHLRIGTAITGKRPDAT
jgi:pyridoxal phosphate enzyme (YggS family)